MVWNWEQEEEGEEEGSVWSSVTWIKQVSLENNLYIFIVQFWHLRHLRKLPGRFPTVFSFPQRIPVGISIARINTYAMTLNCLNIYFITYFFFYFYIHSFSTMHLRFFHVVSMSMLSILILSYYKTVIQICLSLQLVLGIWMLSSWNGHSEYSLYGPFAQLFVNMFLFLKDKWTKERDCWAIG